LACKVRGNTIPAGVKSLWARHTHGNVCASSDRIRPLQQTRESWPCAIDALKPDVNMLCPTCKYLVGQPFSVAINYDYKILRLRCPDRGRDCGRAWDYTGSRA
jgi:hypothetical protein